MVFEVDVDAWRCLVFRRGRRLSSDDCVNHVGGTEFGCDALLILLGVVAEGGGSPWSARHDESPHSSHSS